MAGPAQQRYDLPRAPGESGGRTRQLREACIGDTRGPLREPGKVPMRRILIMLAFVALLLFLTMIAATPVAG